MNKNEVVQPISFLFFKHDHYPLAKCEDLHICSIHYIGSSSIIAGKWCGTFVYTTFNSHLKSDINTNKRQPLFRLRDRYQYWKCLITISRPISIVESCHFDLDTDLDTYFVKISRQYRYDIDISAFLAIPTSISISNQSVSHITGVG